MTREEVTESYHPEGWRVYVIEDETLGFFAGFKPFSQHVPMFCASLNGAEMFDAFRDLSSREKAVAIRDHYMNKATVWAYKRHEILPEQYKRSAS